MDKKLIIAGILVLLIIALIGLVVVSAAVVFFMGEDDIPDLPPVQPPVPNTSPEQGTSMETAIIMQETTSDEGISAEYDWLRANGCPNNGGVVEVEMQELDEDDEGHLYDVLHAVCSDDTVIQYYFNIDNFFGKWE